jgi:hypothetical protein
MSKAIPGIRYSLTVYVASDKLNAATVISIESQIHLPPVENPNLPALLAHLKCEHALEPLGETDDWRLMTDAEIGKYKDSLDD